MSPNGASTWHASYDPDVPALPDFEHVTVPGLLERTATRFPHATALVFMNRRMSYRELKRDVDRLATALAGLGVRKGTSVAIQLPNLPQAVVAYYAALSLGGRAVMTNPLYVERELEHQWNDAECRVAVVADYLFEQRIRAIRDKLSIEHFVVTAIPDYARFPLSYLAKRKLAGAKPPMTARVQRGEGVHSMRKLIRRTRPQVPTVSIDIDDVAVLQYTGGTTGVSKGAMLTHRNLSSNVQQMSAWFIDVEPGRDVFLSALPFFHVFGMTVGMNFPVAVAAAMVIVPDPRDTRRLVKYIDRHKVTVFPGVPAQYNAINKFRGIDRYDLTSVKACISGSAPLPRDVAEQFERLTHARIVEGFGLTETSPVTHSNPLNGTSKTGSIGLPLPGTDAKIVSLEDGLTELPAGGEGELLIRGPQVMKGYWKRPDETAATIVEGWLHTGDIAKVDEDGYFFIVGRKKDVIIAGGYNIYPDEIDDVLTSHPAVSEAATIGIPDPRRGETVKSFVVLMPGAAASVDELVKHCRRELAAYKVPRAIEFRDSLPKSGALKILRRQLRDEELKRAANA